MVCFGGHSFEEDLEWSEPQIKDSGVDTCSSTTLNEEHSQSEKVVGGKMTESGRLCAFITKVKKGSLADTVGHLRPGDEVLEWNGRLLQGATFEEIKLWYDKVGHQLIVTILGAKDLPSREDGRPRNPYVKIYFLPDRSDKNKRRTKTRI
ncbi:Regulating synaptic membrane exocytosis protein 2 [Varanus komodoensis]|nr:Regulating synaptic membrane exocytosis protein 2 [Varanus komodoensis]